MSTSATVTGSRTCNTHDSARYLMWNETWGKPSGRSFEFSSLRREQFFRFVTDRLVVMKIVYTKWVAVMISCLPLLERRHMAVYLRASPGAQLTSVNVVAGRSDFSPVRTRCRRRDSPPCAGGNTPPFAGVFPWHCVLRCAGTPHTENSTVITRL